MLYRGTMSRFALALVLVAGSASVASAGGFVGLGIGTGAASSGSLPLDENGRSGRLEVGYRFPLSLGAISVEGFGSRYGMVRTDAHQYTGTTLAIAGRYNFPLGDNFEVFGRLGLHHTSLEPEYDQERYAGNGFLVGAGVEIRIPLGATTLSPFIDYTIQRSSSMNNPDFKDNYPDLTLTQRFWTLGATISF